MAELLTTFLRPLVEARERQLAVEIGDAKQSGFYPQIKTVAFDNESNASVRLLDEDPTRGVFGETDDVVEWARAGRTARIYVEQDDRFESGIVRFDVELAARPSSPTLIFTVQSKGLDFYRQDKAELLLAEPGAIVPEWAEDSIAVYCHKVGDYNTREGVPIRHYRTGKVMHIQRPYVTDARGRRVWCKLEFVDGLLLITMPLDFWGDAVYPVVLDPDFGYTSVGASTTDFSNICTAVVGSGQRYAASSGDTITSFSMYGLRVSGASGGQAMAAYTWNGSAPDARLAAAASISMSATPAWNTTGAVSQALSAGTSYVVAYGPGTIDTIRHYFDSGAQRSRYTGSGTLPSTWVEANNAASVYSMYSSFTAGGGGDQSIVGSGIASAEAFGSDQINLGLSMSGVVTAEAFGTQGVHFSLAASAIASAEAFGDAQVNLALILSAISSGEAFGSHVVSDGTLYLFPVGLASGEAFGAAQLNLSLVMSAISSAEAFGSTLVGLVVLPGGIASAEAFGTAQLNLVILGSGVASAEAFGATVVDGGSTVLIPVGISSEEVFGALSVLFANFSFDPGAAVVVVMLTPDMDFEVMN